MSPSKKSFNIRASKKRKINTDENTRRKRRRVRKIKRTVPKARKQVKRKLKRSRKKQVRRKVKRTRKKVNTLVKRKKVTKHGWVKKPEIKEPKFQGNTQLMCKNTTKKEVKLQFATVRKGTNLKTNLYKVGTEMRKLLREEKMKNEQWVANCKLEVKDLEVWMNKVNEVIKKKINQESINMSVVGRREVLSREESRNNQQINVQVVQLNNSYQENKQHKLAESRRKEEPKKTMKLVEAIMKKTSCTRMAFKPDKSQGENIENVRDECSSIEKKMDCASLADHRGLNNTFESSEISRNGAGTEDVKLKIDDQLKIQLESEMVKIYSCLDNALKKLENEATQLSILRKKKVLTEARCNRDAAIVSTSSFETENQELGEILSKISVNAKLKDLTFRLDVIKNLVHSENNALKEEIVGNLAASRASSKVNKLCREKEERLRSLEKEDKLVTPKKNSLWDKVSKMFPKLRALKYLRNMMGVTLVKAAKDEHSEERTLGNEMLNGT